MRKFLLSIAFLVLSISAHAADQRLNILFVFADDWGRYASAYAKADGRPSVNDVIRTPNVDKLAAEGVLFRNAFVNSPSCTPCRSSMLSGRYFFQTGQGAILRGAHWDSAIPSFPLLLLESGYQIGKTYKVWSPGELADAPFGGQKFAYEKAGRLPNQFSASVTQQLSQGKSLEEAKEVVFEQVRQNFEAFLHDTKPGKPWLYFFGPTNTHRKWLKGSGKALWGIESELLKGKMPAFYPDVPEVREDIADYLGECQAVDAYLGVLLEALRLSEQLDNTMIVVSGDHGIPGVPSGKCNLYDNGTAVSLVVKMPGIKPGRVIDDLVRLPDLAPTFMEVGGVVPPGGLYGRSLLPLLKSEKGGVVESDRNWVVVGRERHVDIAREGNLPYPMRGLRTKDFLYIRNFEPSRTPMGDALQVSDGHAPSFQELENNTYAAFPDMDASPTKAWLVAHRNDAQWRPLFEKTFGKRPAEELYDLAKDPDQVHNVASEAAYATNKAELSRQLQARLKDAGDPRLDDPVPFEKEPFTNGRGKVKEENRHKQ